MRVQAAEEKPGSDPAAVSEMQYGSELKARNLERAAMLAVDALPS